ncbi:MAG: hypothetical protein ACK4G4_12160, partial [Thermus sp.]|uniref:hypothetical protein n=1 Tax=Thermus sp. TaxID=275 RepID=UPI00391C909E
VDVQGLPQGASGQATISGRASLPLTITAGQVSQSLLPGSYSVTFPDIWADPYTLYRPDPASASFKVSSRESTGLRVVYRIVEGNMQVDVSEESGSGAPVDVNVRR